MLERAGTQTRRVLHLASHHGNIGDSFSHIYVQRELAKRTPLEYEEIEIRRYYQNEKHRSLESDFISRIGEQSIGLVGGGAFLQPRFPSTASGTTFDLPPEAVAQCSGLLIFNAVGYLGVRTSDPAAIVKLRHFFDRLAELGGSARWYLRDDGSFEAFSEEIGNPQEFGIGCVPDPAFGLSDEELRHERLDLELPDDFVAINIAGDANEARMAHGPTSSDSIKAITQFVRRTDRQVVFVPHTAQDIKAIGAMIASFDNWSTRSRISVAPLMSGRSGALRSLAIYRGSSAIIANRFHSMVVNLGSDSPLIVLDNAPNVSSIMGKFRLEFLSLGDSGPSEIDSRLEKGNVEEIFRRKSVVALLTKALREHLDDLADEIGRFSPG